MSNTRFEFIMSQREEPSCQLLYIASSRFENDWHSIKHSHACAELFFCIGGKGRFLIHNDVLDVGKRQLVVINANVDHTEQSLADDPLEYMVLGVSGLEFQGGRGPGYTLLDYGPEQECVLFCLRTMLWEIDTRGAQYEAACRNLLSVLLIKIQRLAKLWVEEAAAEPARPVNKNAVWIKQYIDEHYAESLTLAQLADMVRMNKYSFGHLFQRSYGVSPISYLTARRIQEGKQLLEHSDHSVSQIAQFLNFSSLSYFSQRFRLLEGMSPKEYRERCQACKAAQEEVDTAR